MSAVFLGAKRSKRSIVLDLKQPAAREALARLVDGADMFMHSMRPQKLAALGIARGTLTMRTIHAWSTPGCMASPRAARTAGGRPTTT
jgi:crotonobetainyl-CoA:carnitine CoA-transferase CaiB-like acyl-CoA transferase